MQFRRQQTTTWISTLIAAGVLAFSAGALAQGNSGSTVAGPTSTDPGHQAPTQSGMDHESAGMESREDAPGANQPDHADTNDDTAMEAGNGSDYGSANYHTPQPTEARDPMKDDPVDQDTDQATNKPDQHSDDDALPDRGTPEDDAEESHMTGANPNAMSDSRSGTGDANDNMDPHTSGTTIGN